MDATPIRHQLDPSSASNCHHPQHTNTSQDRLIIVTAIPQITNDFHSITDIGWYGSAYLLTTCAFQLLFGKIYTFWSIKTVFLAAVFLFEVGSAVCGAAPNSVVFIIGRAIAGVGGAGIFSGVVSTLLPNSRLGTADIREKHHR